MIVWSSPSQSWGPKMRAAAIMRHLPGYVWPISPRRHEPWGYHGTPIGPRPTRPTLIVADMFFDGTRSDLRVFDCPRVHVRRAGIRPHPDAALDIDVEHLNISPFDPEELPTRGEVRRRLGWPDDRPLVIRAGGALHQPPEVPDSTLRWCRYPLLPTLVGADAVVGNAGWGLANDARIADLPRLLVAAPTSDDQIHRANGTAEGIADFVAAATVLDRPDDWRPYYANHARLIAARIQELAR